MSVVNPGKSDQDSFSPAAGDARRPESAGRVPCWRFGDVEMRPAQRSLSKAGRELGIGGRAFDLLADLVEHRDRVVRKDELLDRVWAGLVVEEGNLKVQVSLLRKALGPQAIATVPGRGYRFVLPVEGDVEPAARASGGALPAPGALPRRATALLGRDVDIARLVALLQRHRAVTVHGTGGIGKSSVALAVAGQVQAREGCRVAWIELAQVGDPADVLAAVARALQLSCEERDDPLAAVLAALRQDPWLLVLDNAEHVAEALARFVDALTRGTTHARALVTSQAPMRLPQELTYRLAPLDIPKTASCAQEARQYGAIAMFEDRARHVDGRFALTDDNVAWVIDICRKVDGLALAIELAAARLPHLGVRGVAERLGSRLALLTRGRRDAPTRQQTVRAALDWSHGLLSADEQAVFRRLGTFIGGFTLDTAGQVAADERLDAWAVIDLLGALVDRSLVAVDAQDPPRYRLLESAREYALERLEQSGECEETRRRHARALLRLAEAACGARWIAPEKQWLGLVAPELDNLRSALDWSAARDRRLAVNLAGAAGPAFECMSLVHEARRRFEPLEGPPQEAMDVGAFARFQLARSRQMRDVSAQRQFALAEAACRGFRQAGDRLGLYEALAAVIDGYRTYPTQALAAFEEMERVVDPGWPAAVRALGRIAESKVRVAQGRFDDEGHALEQARALAAISGADRLAIVALANLANHSLQAGRPDLAVEQGLELADMLRQEGRRTLLSFVLANLANAQLQADAASAARQSLAEALALMRAQDWTWLRGFGDVYALLAAREGRWQDAACLIGWADEARRSRGERQANERAAREVAQALACERLEEKVFARCVLRGRTLSSEEVADAALRAGPAIAAAARARPRASVGPVKGHALSTRDRARLTDAAAYVRQNAAYDAAAPCHSAQAELSARPAPATR
jgi:predicted ATPase/DNA-binding winged helix-turn-helix (wHTH) protein